MDNGVLASLVTGGLSLIGIIVTNIMSNKQIEHKLEVSQAITNTKLDNLTQEVKEHNSNVQQIPVIMERVDALARRIDILEARV